MAINDIVQIRHYCVKGDQLAINVTNWKVTAEVTGGATLQDMAETFADLGETNYPPLLDSSALYRGAQAQKIFPLPKSASAVFSKTTAGLVGGNDLPSQVSGIISLRSSLAGRHNRGRIYIPFPSDGSNTAAGHPNAGYVTNLQAFMTAVFVVQTVVGAGGTTTLKPVILNRTANTTVDIVAGRVKDRWATQRRRGDFGQKNTYDF